MVIRYACLEILAQEVGDNLVLHTVGGTANEWNHLRPGPANMWCSVGSVSSVALGLSMALPHRKTVALDSDGGLLLNLSVLAELGTVQPANLTLIVLDNQVYESTGGQPSATSSGVDLAGMARCAGVEKAVTVRSAEEFQKAVRDALGDSAFHFIVAKLEAGAKKGVLAIELSGVEMKFRFVRHIEQSEGLRIFSPPQQNIPEHLIRD